MTESIFKNIDMTSDRQSWSSILAEAKLDYSATLGMFRTPSLDSQKCIAFLNNRPSPADYNSLTITQEFISQFNVKTMLGESCSSAADMAQVLAGRGINIPNNVLYSGRKAGTTLLGLLNWHRDHRTLRSIDIKDLPFTANRPILNEDILSKLDGMSKALTYLTFRIDANNNNFTRMSQNQEQLKQMQVSALTALGDLRGYQNAGDARTAQFATEISRLRGRTDMISDGVAALNDHMEAIRPPPPR